jgi:hypothetical protein
MTTPARTISLQRRVCELSVHLEMRDRTPQGLDCRPQLIDQRVAVANFLSLLDTGQSVPQRQQPLGAEWGRAQLLVRCNGKLAVIDCRRRLAAQRDPVIANDVLPNAITSA